jgi:hypothetical protein
MPRAVVYVYRDDDGEDPPILTWLNALKKPERKAYAKCLAFIEHLEREGSDLDRPTSGYLRDGINELRPTLRGINYRILYFFWNNQPCISHGIKKEKRVPDIEIERAIERANKVRSDAKRHTQKWEPLK